MIGERVWCGDTIAAGVLACGDADSPPFSLDTSTGWFAALPGPDGADVNVVPTP